MPMINWNNSLSVGFEHIDNQHKHLISLANGLFADLHSGRGGQAVSGVVNDLFAYAQTHFRDEEDLMRQYGYPNQVEHVEDHGRFLNRMVELDIAARGGEPIDPGQMYEFLLNWLRGHVGKFDVELGRHLRARTDVSDRT